MGEIAEACELMCFTSTQDPIKPDCNGIISYPNNLNDPSKPDCNGINHNNNLNDLNSSSLIVPGIVAECETGDDSTDLNDSSVAEQGIETGDDDSSDLNDSSVVVTEGETGDDDSSDRNDSCVIVTEGETGDDDSSDLNDSSGVEQEIETGDDSSDLNDSSVVEHETETGDDDSSDLNDSSVVEQGIEIEDNSSDLNDSSVVVTEGEIGADSINDLNSSYVVEDEIEIGVDSNDLNTSSVGKLEGIDEFPPLVKGGISISYGEQFGETKSWAKVVKFPRKSHPVKVNFLDVENQKLEAINRDVEVEVCNGKTTTDLNGEDMGDGALDGSAITSSNEELNDQENCDSKDISMASSSSGDFSADVINGDSINTEATTKPFNFLIRAPRLDDGSLAEQVRLAKLHLEEKTKARDAIHLQVKEKRANGQIHILDYEERSLVKSKRMEIDSLQLMINKAKNASSIEHMNSQIRNMEHRMQHETLPLNEEKKLIREISQLKQHCRKLYATFGSKDEIRQILEQRKEFDERLKILKEELDVLKGNAVKAQEIANDERKQIRAANDVSQAAYVKLQRLKKQLYETNKHFYKYKDDATLASKYASTRDTNALHRLCMNHVDNFMELWNKNDEFRREYVKFSARSSVRRFGTLDCRSLGPDEVPAVLLPSHVDVTAKMVSTVDVESQMEEVINQETTTENTISSKGEKMKGLVTKGNKTKDVANRGPAIPLHLGGQDYFGSGKETIPEKSRAEIEAELKEKRRLEEIDKANKARERKKLQADKLQMIAELKAVKEAEQKQKEREKRLRKKERKKAAAAAAAAAIDVNIAIEKAASSESDLVISTEKQVEEISTSVAPEIRNRNKKKLQRLIWASIVIIVIVLVLWLVSTSVFPNLTIKW